MKLYGSPIALKPHKLPISTTIRSWKPTFSLFSRQVCLNSVSRSLGGSQWGLFGFRRSWNTIWGILTRFLYKLSTDVSCFAKVIQEQASLTKARLNARLLPDHRFGKLMLHLPRWLLAERVKSSLSAEKRAHKRLQRCWSSDWTASD